MVRIYRKGQVAGEVSRMCDAGKRLVVCPDADLTSDCSMNFNQMRVRARFVAVLDHSVTQASMEIHTRIERPSSQLRP